MQRRRVAMPLACLLATASAPVSDGPGAPATRRPAPPPDTVESRSTATRARSVTGAGERQARVTRYVRYRHENRVSYGILDGETIRELAGDLFAQPRATGRTLPRDAVTLLAPCVPSKIIAVGLNYRSHLGNRPVPQVPGLFAKYPTSVVGPEASIVMPPDATNLHYEGEMAVVIGRLASKVPVEEAREYVFGVTAGNDVSEREWQRADLQWLRAKASDTFAPLGPAIVTGLDYDDLALETRLNGERRQTERTRDLIFDVPTIVSYVSRYITLQPGDVIFTGTPGTTAAMQPGDVVEVELEGVGVLRNTVVRVDAGTTRR